MRRMKEKKAKIINNKKLQGKLIHLFAVIPMEDFKALKSHKAKLPGKFLTITQTEDDAMEYIMIMEIEEHKEHYCAWCEQRNLNPLNDSNWEMYRTVVIGDDCDYAVYEMNIYWEDVVAFLRMFQGCIPVGCLYEREIESVYFAKQIKKMYQDKLNEDEENPFDSYEPKKINPEDIVN